VDRSAAALAVLPRRVAARLAAGGERKGHLHRLLRRLREVKLCDLRLLEVLAAVGDLADALPSRMTVGLSSYATVSSFRVPMPPEIMITASAARTVSVLRIQPMPVVTAMSTNSLASRLSNPGRIPITRPPALLAPRLTASMTPESPPVTTMPLRSAMRRPTSSAIRSAFSGTGSRGSFALLPMIVMRVGRVTVR